MDRPNKDGHQADAPGSSVAAEEQKRLAEAVREACARAAIEAYEEAGLAGLCDEGRWEAAIDRLRTLNLEPILDEIKPR